MENVFFKFQLHNVYIILISIGLHYAYNWILIRHRPALSSLIDVILPNSKHLLCNTINFNCGLCDCHNMICTSLKEQRDPVVKKIVVFRL